jgi:hypothetical protein
MGVGWVSSRPGRLPAQAPHRSGRAEFPHPALRAHGFASRRQAPHTCWSSNTRQLSYPMQSRLDGFEVRCPLHLSLHRFHVPAPPSLLRVPLGSVPRTHRYYETLRLPAIHPGGLVDSPAGTVLALLDSLPPSTSAPNGGPGFWFPGSPTGFLERRQQDLPSSRQILSIHALLPSDPGGTGTPGHSALAILPSAPDTASAPTNSDFGAQ